MILPSVDGGMSAETVWDVTSQLFPVICLWIVLNLCKLDDIMAVDNCTWACI